jgi:glycerol uptake facilitator protein
VAIAAQLVGAFIGAVLCWLAYKQHFDEEPDPATKLGVFSTGPAIRSYGWNLVTEDHRHLRARVRDLRVRRLRRRADRRSRRLGPLTAVPVALLVVGIGASLGGPTGYAINPARDLGPRIAHAILPIKGKGSSDWSYAWVPSSARCSVARSPRSPLRRCCTSRTSDPFPILTHRHLDKDVHS